MRTFQPLNQFFIKFSGFTYNFVLQNQFLHRKFYTKNQKKKNAFLNPKKTFSYKTYEQNFVLLKKFALQKYLQNIKKNIQGKKLEPPKSWKSVFFV